MSGTFDPNAPAAEGSGIFGLPFAESEAALVYVPVPWEATTSYGGGTSRGPEAIFRASRQVDLFDLEVHEPYAAGLYMREIADDVVAWNDRAKMLARRIIDAGGDVSGSADLARDLAEVNALGEALNAWVKGQTAEILAAKRIPAIIGGDHSVPLGAIEAAADAFGAFGILHFDAHADLRDAYEGFVHSHASIMRNVVERVRVQRITQVGIRDVCREEMDYIAKHHELIRTFFAREMAQHVFAGKSFREVAHRIVDTLPEQVWVSFDIDGLDPALCPHTGTPVPGGLSFDHATYIVGELVVSGRRIIGFDLNEVAPNLKDPDDEWDANVGARLLYKLTGFTLASQGRVKLRSPVPS